MTTQYAQSYEGTSPFSDTCSKLALAANTAVSYTVPGTSANRYKIVFSWPYNANVYVGYNVTATTPSAGNITSSPNLALRPLEKFVSGGDVLSFISSAVVADGAFELFSIA